MLNNTAFASQGCAFIEKSLRNTRHRQRFSDPNSIDSALICLEYILVGVHQWRRGISGSASDSNVPCDGSSGVGISMKYTFLCCLLPPWKAREREQAHSDESRLAAEVLNILREKIPRRETGGRRDTPLRQRAAQVATRACGVVEVRVR